MARILSHPFRVLQNGAVATVDQTSDEANAEQLAVLILTRVGDRPLVPGFGVTDPTYKGVDASEIAAGIQAFGPAITLGTIEVTAPSEAEQDVVIHFT